MFTNGPLDFSMRTMGGDSVRVWIGFGGKITIQCLRRVDPNGSGPFGEPELEPAEARAIAALLNSLADTMTRGKT